MKNIYYYNVALLLGEEWVIWNYEPFTSRGDAEEYALNMQKHFTRWRPKIMVYTQTEEICT